MPKTRFIRKACTLDEVRERTQWLERYCGEQPLDRYYVAKEIQLQENDFFELCDNLLVDRDWVAAFSNIPRGMGRSRRFGLPAKGP